MGEEKGYIADLTPGSVDEKAQNPGTFPTEAWEFTKAGDANPTLTLKSAWDLVVAGDQSVSGALSAGSGAVSGAWDVGSLTLGGTTAGISLSGVDLTLTPGTDGRVISSVGFYPLQAIFEHQASDGTNGGTATSGAWRDLPITTEISNALGITVASDTLTVPAGKYIFRIRHVLFAGNYVSIRIYNNTSSVLIEQSINNYMYYNTGVGGEVSVETKIVTLVTDTEIKFQYQVATTVANTGLGFANGFSNPEIYGRYVIERVG